jgi:hypothetical protein
VTGCDDLQNAASVTILAIGYRARCAAPGSGNLARAMLLYASLSSPLSASTFIDTTNNNRRR